MSLTHDGLLCLPHCTGGSFWAEAFYSILADVRAKVPPSMFMTEGIVEEVSGTGFDIMLGPCNPLPLLCIYSTK